MKKLNNKGFTVVELILSFLFVFTLAISMYQLLSNYRDKQQEESIKSQLIDYKNEVTLAIQNDISDRTLKKIDYCINGGKVVDRCLVLYFNDGTTKQLAVEKGTKEYDGEEYDIHYISYGGVFYEAADAILLDYRSDYILFHDDIGDNMTVYHIMIPIYHYDLDGNYGISIVAIGYDYDYKSSGGVTAGGEVVQTPPEELTTEEGRKYNGYVTTTNRLVNNKMNQQTIIARVKFDSANISSYQQFFGNWQLGGSGLSLGSKTATNSRKPCFSAYISTNDDYLSTYTEVCSDVTLNPDTFYTVVGTFDNGTMSIYVNGDLKKSKKILNNPSIDVSSLAFAIGGNPGKINNNNLLYGTISNAVVYNRTIAKADVTACLSSSVDTACLKGKGYADTSKIIDEKLTK